MRIPLIARNLLAVDPPARHHRAGCSPRSASTGSRRTCEGCERSAEGTLAVGDRAQPVHRLRQGRGDRQGGRGVRAARCARSRASTASRRRCSTRRWTCARSRGAARPKRAARPRSARRNSSSSRRLAKSSSSRASAASSASCSSALRRSRAPARGVPGGPPGRRGCNAAPGSRDAPRCPRRRWRVRPRGRTVAQRVGAEGPLPRRRGERRRAAEAQHRGARLLGDRMAVGAGIGDEDVGAGGSVEASRRRAEARAAPGDEIQLLVGELGALGVRLDDVVARLRGGVGVGAEGAGSPSSIRTGRHISVPGPGTASRSSRQRRGGGGEAGAPSRPLSLPRWV